MKGTLKSPGRPVCLALMEFDASLLSIRSETMWRGVMANGIPTLQPLHNKLANFSESG